jgi:hypothetical protein
MFPRSLRFTSIAVTAVILSAGVAWALGHQLGETKEQLRLQYEVASVDHGTGRVTVTLTLADEGRLKPLTAVDLFIPGEARSGPVDLSVTLAREEAGGKQVARVHLKRELAERAELWLRTSTLDGRRHARTWYYHAIPLADHIRKGAQKKD